MKRIVRTRIRVISDIAKEKEDLAHPCPDIFTRERHDRDNRPPSLLPCPFLKAELKSFSTGVQRPPIPRPSGKEREKKGERKPRTVVNATRWPPPRLSVNTDANRPPQKFFSASCQPGQPSPLLLPRTTWCIATHLDRVQFFRPPTTYSTYVSHGRKILGGG